MIKKMRHFLYIFYKKIREVGRFGYYRFTNKGAIKIVVGSAGIYDKGWIPTEAYILDLLKENRWKIYFKEASISNILAEHVWEHLNEKDGFQACQTCFKFLKQKGGRLRIAVPDGFHPSKEYIDYVKPGGNGAGADDHKILYTYKSMVDMLIKAGFDAELLEYFDENGVFHQMDWHKNEGFVQRSIRFDKRNKDGKPNYTSLIVDAIKH